MRSCEDVQATVSTSSQLWICCSQTFSNLVEIQRHVSREHQEEVTSLVSEIKGSQPKDSVEEMGIEVETSNYAEHAVDYEKFSIALSERMSVWRSGCADCGLVVLFYKYTDIPSPQALATWQQKLCDRLALTGKVQT